MEEKPGKKKESIDEILSDLNGLLNKMPSILDGIKMPELQPQEAPKPAPEAARPPQPEPVESQPPAADGDKTVVLPPFAGLDEGAPAPEEAQPQPAPAPLSEPAPVEPEPEPAVSFDAEKTVVLESFSGLPEGAPAPEPERLAPQSLGDFMYGPDAGDAPAQETPAPAKLSGSFLEPPTEVPAVRPSGPSLSISEFTPPAEAAPEASLPAAPAPADAQPSLPAYDSTKDFGIPDIDALMQMSDLGAAPAQPEQPLPEAGVLPDSLKAIEESKEEPSIQGLDAAPAQEETPEVAIVESKDPKEENAGLTPDAAAPEIQPVAEPEAQPAVNAENPFDAFAIEPAVPPQEEGGGLVLEPSAEMPQGQEAGETLNEVSGEMPAAQEGAETLKFEAPAEALSSEAQPSQEGGPLGGVELASGIETAGGADQTIPGGQGLELSVGQPEIGGADQTIPGGQGLELSVGQPETGGADQTIPGGQGLELSVGQPEIGGASQGPGGSGMELGGGSGDATLVVPPPGGSSGDEEKTVVFQAAPPSTTSRAQAGDLEGLAAKQPPEGIPAERLRTLMFIYAAEDKALCATALAELDAICLKSSTKPMFIKRASVKECEPDANANFIQQSVTESGAQGLVCLGAVPQEKVYEIENVFGASGGFFRYYDSSTFSHSAALDLVTDLILR